MTVPAGRRGGPLLVDRGRQQSRRGLPAPRPAPQHHRPRAGAGDVVDPGPGRAAAPGHHPRSRPTSSRHWQGTRRSPTRCSGPPSRPSCRAVTRSRRCGSWASPGTCRSWCSPSMTRRISGWCGSSSAASRTGSWWDSPPTWWWSTSSATSYTEELQHELEHLTAPRAPAGCADVGPDPCRPCRPARRRPVTGPARGRSGPPGRRAW